MGNGYAKAVPDLISCGFADRDRISDKTRLDPLTVVVDKRYAVAVKRLHLVEGFVQVQVLCIRVCGIGRGDLIAHLDLAVTLGHGKSFVFLQHGGVGRNFIVAVGKKIVVGGVFDKFCKCVRVEMVSHDIHIIGKMCHLGIGMGRDQAA